VSFQITVLKVLAGHPGGQLSVAELTRAVSILMSSGRDWTDRTKRMLARAPDLDIFGQNLVVRDDAGWQITDAGRTLLASIEKPAAAQAVEPALPVPVAAVVPPLIGTKRRTRRRRRAPPVPPRRRAS
jgi:hypothetical protein